MPVYKKKLAKNRVSWYYLFELPGGDRQQCKQGGFATKGEAETAEAERRLKETAAAQKAAGEIPKTLGDVITEWVADCRKSWSPKTAERYGELAAYLAKDVTAMAIVDVQPLHLHREWKRLAESGGHHRRTKEARPLSAKTVKHIAGVVSSAYAWAILYGLVTINPATHSKPPRVTKRKGIALAPAQTDLLIDAADGQWAVFLETEAALGARRGEVLALRWSDIIAGKALIARSLGQAAKKTYFKGTKKGNVRDIDVPERTLAILEHHRHQQGILRAQFGADYRTDLDLIFAEPDGEPLKPDSVSSKISLLCRKLKLPKGASLHTLRHSHGSLLVAGGVTIPEVAERLGHDPAVTLGIYSHAIPGREDLAKRWEKMQTEKGKAQ